MEGKTCIQCGEFKPLTAFDVSFAGVNASNGYTQRESRKSRCNRCYGVRERVRVKLRFIAMYGGQCSCCGQADPRFLTLDHVSSDGSEHRKLLADNQIMALAVKGYQPDRFQILCYNCNCGRSANGGLCPHKDKSLEDYLAYTEILLGPAPKQPSKVSSDSLKKALAGLTSEQIQELLSKLGTRGP